MVQELARIKCSCKLMKEEKGPLSATTVLYYQKDDIDGTLVRDYTIYICTVCG